MFPRKCKNLKFCLLQQILCTLAESFRRHGKKLLKNWQILLVYRILFPRKSKNLKFCSLLGKILVLFWLWGTFVASLTRKKWIYKESKILKNSENIIKNFTKFDCLQSFVLINSHENWTFENLSNSNFSV